MLVKWIHLVKYTINANIDLHKHYCRYNSYIDLHFYYLIGE